MLSLTRKTDYALVALAELARHGSEWTSAREIAESVGIPLPVLNNILHHLLHHGLVSSTMGSKGGYRLAKEPFDITLADMIDAIEGRFRLAVCCSGEGEAVGADCDLESSCRIREPVRRVHRGMREFLRGVNLAQLAFGSELVNLEVSGAAAARAVHP